MSIILLDDEESSPKGKGPYFANPDFTSRLFDGLSLASLSQSLLDDMRKFEARALNIPKRSREEARQLTDFHNHPDVVDEWENSDQEDDDYEGPEWFYGALAAFVFTVKNLYGTYQYLKQAYPEFDPKVIVDWGAGLGMHSLISSFLWPNAKVVYFNLPGMQTDFARWIKEEYGAENMIIKTQRKNLPKKADFILCYEFLEHMKKPVDATEDVLSLNPEFVSVSFSFTAPCRGHFTYFEVDDEEIPREEVTRWVNDVFREKYTAAAHGWNARPVLWKAKKR